MATCSGDRQQHLQRQPGADAGAARPRGPPALPGPRDWPAAEGVSVHLPDIGRVLPVYVADEYEGFDAKPFPELTDAELEHYIDANVAAVRAVRTPDVALANHLVMGPLVLARALAGRRRTRSRSTAARSSTPCAQPRALPAVRARGDAAARGVLVGSHHTGESLFEVLADEPSLRERTRLGRPGVDVHTSPAPGGSGALASSAREPPAGLVARQEPPRFCAARPVPRPDRQLRGQADRVEGGGPAAGGVAAPGGSRARRSACS